MKLIALQGEPGQLRALFNRAQFVNLGACSDDLEGCRVYRVELDGKPVAHLALRAVGEDGLEVTGLQAIDGNPLVMARAWSGFLRLVKAGRLLAVASSEGMERLLQGFGFTVLERGPQGTPVMQKVL